MAKGLTDKQIAVVLIKNWIEGVGTYPPRQTGEEMAVMASLERPLSDLRRKRVVEQFHRVMRPFEDRIDLLFSNIKEFQ